MIEQHSSPWSFLLLELGFGTAFAHHVTAIPPWIGGAMGALVVGMLLRVLDPSLKRIGERLAARRSTHPPPPVPRPMENSNDPR